MTQSIESRKQRWADLLEPPNGGRKFVFRVSVRNPNPPPVVRAWPWLKAERIEAAWQAYLEMLERAEWLDDDLVPYMSVATGTEIFAEALGCEVYRPDDNNPFAIPFVHSVKDAQRVWTPRLEDTPLTLLFEIADEVGNVNARMFDRFFLDELNALSERYGGIGIHCCANSEHQWPGFAQVKGLRLINLHQPPPVIERAYAFFGPLTAQMQFDLWHGASRLLPLRPRDAFPACCHVVIQGEVEDRDEAVVMVERLWREYGD